MSELKGTETEKNLLKAFAGECQARTRYDMAAKIADKEGYHQIADIFRETAINEYSHAKQFYRALGEEPAMVEITACYPHGMGDTMANLKAAAEGENEEHTDLYPGFAAKAREEGFPKIAAVFQNVAEVEVEHERRYNKLIERIEKGEVFKRPQPIRWKCRVCGRVHEGVEPPKVCPTCLHSREHYEELGLNY